MLILKINCKTEFKFIVMFLKSSYLKTTTLYKRIHLYYSTFKVYNTQFILVFANVILYILLKN